MSQSAPLRILVSDTSSRLVAVHVAAIAGAAGVGEVRQVEGDWSATVTQGDIVVSDYRTDRSVLAGAAGRGAAWLHILSAGVDRQGVEGLDYEVITCSRGISAGPIAEYVFAMILAREKQLAAVFGGDAVEGALGELGGRTLAVYGLGAIGGNVARLGLAFGMRVVAVRRSDRPLPPELETVTVVPDVAALVAEADHIALCAALTPATRGTFGADVWELTKPGAHLVNIARGGLVDTASLIGALDTGRLGAASLDVTDPEPLPADHPLRHHPRVTVTPHLAGRVAAAEHRNWKVFIDNIERYRQGVDLVGVVDRTHGY